MFLTWLQFLCIQAAEEELIKAKEQLKLLHTSLAAASLELEAKERLEYDLKAMTLSLEIKQEELDTSKVGVGRFLAIRSSECNVR